VRHASSADLFNTDFGHRLVILLHFDTRAFIHAYFLTPDSPPFVPPLCALLFLAFVILSWRHPLLRTVALIAFFTSIANPIGTGIHSVSERFMYLPALMTALMYSVASCNSPKAHGPFTASRPLLLARTTFPAAFCRIYSAIR